MKLQNLLTILLVIFMMVSIVWLGVKKKEATETVAVLQHKIDLLEHNVDITNFDSYLITGMSIWLEEDKIHSEIHFQSPPHGTNETVRRTIDYADIGNISFSKDQITFMAAEHTQVSIHPNDPSIRVFLQDIVIWNNEWK